MVARSRRPGADSRSAPLGGSFALDAVTRSKHDASTATLESIVARNPDHPGAIHLYIHAVEASSTPQRAEAGADRLADLAPGSGHLVHMPSHIFLRVGRYADATRANERAAQADESYINQCRVQGFYPALYYPATAAAAYGADAAEKYGYPADVLLRIAGRLLDAGIARNAGDDAAVIAALEQAVALEDGLPYMEPPYWFFPNRPLLGAALLARGRAAEAEAVFRRDLEKVPNNGWSLHGLAASLTAQGRTTEADAAAAQFAAAWQRADVTLGADGIQFFEAADVKVDFAAGD